MFVLNEQSRKNIERVTGIKYDELKEMDFDDIDNRIEKTIKKKLKPMNTKDGYLPGRGQMYYFFKRLMSKDDIEKGISHITQ